ncbi:hypothetical protein [Methanohalophilus levihalophilus]|uniref:hypothetical protein n=1 Tax=Methanohalophilus levihalophilus TaxID=1431282 RepID=UPI001AE13029|nr:hypothetical protein [Methanohalophilus levihalophilus]
MSSEFYEYILYELEESDKWSNLTIVELPIGDLQSSPDDAYSLYVDQHCGACGDDFYGTVCMSLPCKKYLLWSFQM